MDEYVALTFPQRLMEVLDDESYKDIISWVNDGFSFMIHQEKIFTEIILPKHFNKACKYSSFSRKLNRWGFQRCCSGPFSGSFSHPLFKKGGHKLLSRITCDDKAKPDATKKKDDSTKRRKRNFTHRAESTGALKLDGQHDQYYSKTRTAASAAVRETPFELHVDRAASTASLMQDQLSTHEKLFGVSSGIDTRTKYQAPKNDAAGLLARFQKGSSSILSEQEKHQLQEALQQTPEASTTSPHATQLLEQIQQENLLRQILQHQSQTRLPQELNIPQTLLESILGNTSGTGGSRNVPPPPIRSSNDFLAHQTRSALTTGAATPSPSFLSPTVQPGFIQDNQFAGIIGNAAAMAGHPLNTKPSPAVESILSQAALSVLPTLASVSPVSQPDLQQDLIQYRERLLARTLSNASGSGVASWNRSPLPGRPPNTPSAVAHLAAAPSSTSQFRQLLDDQQAQPGQVRASPANYHSGREVNLVNTGMLELLNAGGINPRQTAKSFDKPTPKDQ